jgi:hypothetical protein
MDRKYRQRGYDDAAREKRPAERPKVDRDGPRSPNMTAFQGVMRCGMCGAVQPLDPTAISSTSTCPNCSADLRTCRNCVNFDPSARWECRAEIRVRVSSKTKRNECELFTPRKTVEKKTGETRSKGSGPTDARDAFERLFKK